MKNFLLTPSGENLYQRLIDNETGRLKFSKILVGDGYNASNNGNLGGSQISELFVEGAEYSGSQESTAVLSSGDGGEFDLNGYPSAVRIRFELTSRARSANYSYTIDGKKYSGSLVNSGERQMVIDQSLDYTFQFGYGIAVELDYVEANEIVLTTSMEFKNLNDTGKSVPTSIREFVVYVLNPDNESQDVAFAYAYNDENPYILITNETSGLFKIVFEIRFQTQYANRFNIDKSDHFYNDIELINGELFIREVRNFPSLRDGTLYIT